MKPATLPFALLLACSLASCSYEQATPPPSPVSSTGQPIPSDADVTVVFTLQSIGMDGREPAGSATAAHALGCVSYRPEPPNPGGPRWEVHLRVAGDELNESLDALRAYGVSRLRVAAPDAFSVPPDTTVATGADPLAC